MFSNKNIREISIKILNNVFSKGKNLKIEFEDAALDLTERDLSFLKFSVFGVIRIKKSLDDLISSLYLGNYHKINETNKNILRLGIFQIQFMNSVPNYAAVNSMVEIAKSQNVKFSKIVNAILNRFIRERKEVTVKHSTYNYSSQIIDCFKSEHTAQDVEKICSWNDQLPAIWLRIKEEKRKEIFKLFNSKVKKFGKKLNYLKTDKINSHHIKKYLKKGDLRVQSPSSGLIVDLLDIKRNEEVIDACAAPGGKASHILELVNRDNLFWVNDNHKQRYDKLKKDFQSYEINFLCKDASSDRFSCVDKILLDVPCSSIGTIQKNPDIKWKKIDFNKLSELQFKILQNMSKSLKSKGAIVYSTCSMSNKENFRVIQKFLNLNSNFKIDDASKYVDGKFVNSEGCISIFPPKHKIEGVFAVRLIKE